MNNATIQIYALVGGLPVYIVLFAGLILAVRAFRDRPTASLLTAAAIVLAVATRLIMPFVSQMLVLFFRNNPTPELQILVSTLLYSISSAISYVLLFWAIFLVREPSPWSPEEAPLR